MTAVQTMIRFLKDEAGITAIEYALIAAILVIAAIALVTAMGAY